MKNETMLINFENKIPMSFSIVKFDTIYRHMHNMAQLLLILDGECDIFIGNRCYHASSDDLVIINPQQSHHIISQDVATLISVLIDVNGFSIDGGGDNIYFNLNSMEVKNNPRYNTIRYLLYSIIAYNTMENVNSIYTNRAIAYSFFAQLVNDFKVVAPKETTLNKESLDTINKINGYLNDHYREKITLTYLSEKFNYSVSYLSRLYKNSYGLNFIDIYDNLRINHSLNDLLQGNKTVQEISDEHGFEDVRSYVRAFKKINGTTPNQYRQKYERKAIKLINTDNKLFRKQALDKILSKYEQYGSPNAHKDNSVRATEMLIPIDLKGKTRKIKCKGNEVLELFGPSDLVNELVTKGLSEAKKDLDYKYLLIPHILAKQTHILNRDEYNQWNINYVYFSHILNKIIENNALPYLIFEYNEDLLNVDEFYTLVNQMLDYMDVVFKDKLDGAMISFSKTRKPNKYTDPNSEESITLYNSLFQTVRRRENKYKIGTPLFYRKDIESHDGYFSFLDRIKKLDLDFDFIPIKYVDDFSDDSNLSKNRHEMADFISYLKQNNGFIENKMFFHGVNFTNNESLLNDTLYASSYLIENFIENEKDLSSFSKNSFVDRTSVSAYDANQYHGKDGMLTYDYIKKSSYNAYCLLSKLENNVLSNSSNYLVTINENRLVILLNNYNHYSDLFADKEYFQISNLNRYTCFPKSTNITYKLKINNLNYNSAKIKISTISKKSGSSYDKWLDMGGNKLLNKDEIEVLKHLSEIDYSSREEFITSEVLELNVTVGPLETKLVEIKFN